VPVICGNEQTWQVGRAGRRQRQAKIPVEEDLPGLAFFQAAFSAPRPPAACPPPGTPPHFHTSTS
jgi:hypothetical protein